MSGTAEAVVPPASKVYVSIHSVIFVLSYAHECNLFFLIRQVLNWFQSSFQEQIHKAG